MSVPTVKNASMPLYDAMLKGFADGLLEDDFDIEKYIDPDPIRWITTHFYIPETNSPLPLYPSQIIPLREALSRDENGLFKYSTVVWSSIKKSGKSVIAAAVAMWFMFQEPWRSGKIIAHDLKQADSRVAFYCRRAIELNPEWKQFIKPTRSAYKIDFPNHSVLEAIPVDPEGEAGSLDDFVSYTELWTWRGKTYDKMWTESTLAPTKYGKSLRWVDSYAGFSGESLILENLYKSTVLEGECINEEYQMYRNGRTFCLWNTEPHLPFQTPEYYAQEAQTLVESEFNRVHRNQWQSSENKFVPFEWWDACKMDYPQLDARTPCTIALDAAISGDCFGLLMVSPLPGNDEEYCVRYARKWTPPTNQKIQFSGGDGPEDELRRLLKTYNIIEVAYDPYQLEDLAQRMIRDMIAHMYAFSQQSERLVADKRLYDMIRDRRIHHNGDPDLTEHIQNANQQQQGENKIRIVKRSELLKIDLAVCLSMALDRAVFWLK